MKKIFLILLVLTTAIFLRAQNECLVGENCTSIMVGKKASADGSLKLNQSISAVNEYYPTCVKVDVNPQEDPSTGVAGTITWPFNTGAEGQTATLSSMAETGITSTSITVGEHLKYVGKKTSDIAMTGFTITDETTDSEAKAENAVSFNFVIKEGYKFTLTNVSFYATRFGTDKGKFLSYLQYSDKSKHTICGETWAYRESGKTSSSDDTPTPKHSTVDTPVNDANTMTGSNTLVIHLYEIPYNKSMGLANIVISGMITSPTGISAPVSFSPALSTEYYNVAGQKVDSNAKGIVILRQRMADGTTQTKKVFR